MYLFNFCTCFEQPRAHHQENQLCQYSLWYMTVSCAGLRPAYETVTDTEWHIPEVVLIQLILLMMSTGLLETCRESKQIYIKGIVCHVGYYLLELYRNARSQEYKKSQPLFLILIHSNLFYILSPHSLRHTLVCFFNLRLGLPNGHQYTFVTANLWRSWIRERVKLNHVKL